MLKMLSQGTKDVDVFVLQAQLNLAFPASTRLVLDGIFGPLTRRRVLEFQRTQQLAIDGIVGPRTWDALSRVRGRSEPPPSFGFLCGNGNPLNQQKASGFVAALRNYVPSPMLIASTGTRLGGAAGAIAPAGPILTPLVGSRFESAARAVYQNSLDYSSIMYSSQVGAQNRPFTVVVSNPPKNVIVLNLGPSPSTGTLIHELGHAWQSQHHSAPGAYAANCVACQAAALAANVRIVLSDPEVRKNRSFPENYPMSAYAYRPGAVFGTYAGEQIAQQIENGEAPIRAHVAGVAAGARDAENVKSIAATHITIEDRRDPGVRM